MQCRKREFVIKLVTYFVLSYLMALVSIVFIFSFIDENNASASIRNIFNILFSTNACFISTTGWSVKKDSHPFDTESSSGDLVYLSMISGLLISVAFVVISTVTEYFSMLLYVGGLLVTFVPCVYLAWIYTKEAIKKEEIVSQHDTEMLLKKAKEMMKAKDETSFSMSGSDYKV